MLDEPVVNHKLNFDELVWRLNVGGNSMIDLFKLNFKQTSSIIQFAQCKGVTDITRYDLCSDRHLSMWNWLRDVICIQINCMSSSHLKCRLQYQNWEAAGKCNEDPNTYQAQPTELGEVYYYQYPIVRTQKAWFFFFSGTSFKMNIGVTEKSYELKTVREELSIFSFWEYD